MIGAKDQLKLSLSGAETRGGATVRRREDGDQRRNDWGRGPRSVRCWQMLRQIHRALARVSVRRPRRGSAGQAGGGGKGSRKPPSPRHDSNHPHSRAVRSGRGAPPQECLDKAKRHLQIMRAYDAFAPKSHKRLHLVLRMAAQGNATAYHNFADESANKTLRARCRNASQANV